LTLTIAALFQTIAALFQTSLMEEQSNLSATTTLGTLKSGRLKLGPDKSEI
jgi:hypothetical protein